MAKLLVIAFLADLPSSVDSAPVVSAINRGSVTTKDDMPKCSCACCTTQYRGNGTRFGRQGLPAHGGDPEFACAPLVYGQTFSNAGFADCNMAYGMEGQFCRKDELDPYLGRNT